jgi:hypothetical protein
LSSTTPTTATPTSTSGKKSAGGVAGFFARVSSFIIGAGVTALITQYYIHREIVEGNKLMISKQRDIEDRLHKLEKQIK